MQMPPHSRHS